MKIISSQLQEFLQASKIRVSFTSKMYKDTNQIKAPRWVAFCCAT